MRTVFACAAVAMMLAAVSSAPAQGPVLSGVVLTNDRTVDATSHQSIAKAIWRDGMNEQQKAYAMWRFFIARNMHKEAASVTVDGGNASELLTKTGYCVCGQWASLFSGCMADNGMPAASVWLNGHTIAAANYWGDWHAYDVDMLDLYVKADGVVANPREIKNLKTPDGKWLLRDGAPIKSFPWYLGPDSIAGNRGMYEKASIQETVPPQEKRKWVYDLRLRPGQELNLGWYGDPDIGFVCLSHLPDTYSAKPAKTLRAYLEGTYDYYMQQEGKPKWNWGYRRGGLRPNPLQTANGVGGNGRLTMDLGADGFKNALAMASAADNLEVKDGKLTLKDAAKPGVMTLDFTLPYAYGDAWLAEPLPAKGLKVELGYAGKDFRQVYPGGAGVDDGQRIRLFDLVRSRSSFELRLTLEPGAAPLGQFKAVGAFYLCHTVLPAALKGKNQIAVRLADPKLLADNPLHATYVYDQVADDKQVLRVEKVITFKPDSLTAALDTGDKHWPLMREIRLKVGGPAPREQAPVAEPGELDWAAAPWDWIYHGVNFWNDFERGDRGRWVGQLTTKNTCGGSDFALRDSLLNADGSRQLKIIYFAAFLNRDTKFRCQLWVKNVAKLSVTSRNQDEAKDNYYSKDFADLKDGAWQPLELSFNDLANGAKKVQNNWFLANIYLQVHPAEGKEIKDVEFAIDNVVCWDGELKNDPIVDPDAPKKSLADDPIWNAKKPEAAKPL